MTIISGRVKAAYSTFFLCIKKAVKYYCYTICCMSGEVTKLTGYSLQSVRGSCVANCHYLRQSWQDYPRKLWKIWRTIGPGTVWEGYVIRRYKRLKERLLNQPDLKTLHRGRLFVIGLKYEQRCLCFLNFHTKGFHMFVYPAN